MTRKILLPLAAAALLLSAACTRKQHEFQPNEYGGAPVGYITPQLEWGAEGTAPAAAFDTITIRVQGSNGLSRTRQFTTIEASAAWLQQLPAGEYDVLVTIDMDEASGYLLASAGTPGGSLLTPTSVLLANPQSSPSQSWFGVTHVTVREDEIAVAKLRLQPLLAQLEFAIDGVPEGYVVDAQVQHVAQSVLLTDTAADGRYGLVSAAELTLDFGRMAVSGHTHSLAKRFMPTALQQERTLISLKLHSPQGTDKDCTVDAPRMLMGKVYKLRMVYDDVHPYIYISNIDVTDWTPGTDLDGGQAEE